MPLPIVPILAALGAGGTLVPHAAGGMIVTSAAGYVAGTYLSTSAISTLIYTLGGSGLAAVGVGAAALAGAGGAIVGSAGIFGTSIGATGITGVLMSAGLISSTPIAIPLACIAGVAGIGMFGLHKARMRQLRLKLAAVPKGDELVFSESDAKLIEKILKWFGRQAK
ncbi:hypothetical protein HCG45_06625 [Pseudomonas fulva]|uniref:hypothetical protein n=1 Tax=Pseudomonas fulva TaxID=47880 RepID=UPI001428D09C|nr:hypothetical protein [Pseudomonas fulva]NIX92415.1 hypothetical protein [Pseudomonas fulva]